MACKFICDGCGKEVAALLSYVNWDKPKEWLQRRDADILVDACSRECLKRIIERIKKSFPY